MRTIKSVSSEKLENGKHFDVDLVQKENKKYCVRLFLINTEGLISEVIMEEHDDYDIAEKRYNQLADFFEDKVA